MTLLPRALGRLKRGLRAAGLLPHARRLYYWLHARSSRGPGYFLKSALEQANYADVEEVHELPKIHDYWSNTYLLPKVREFGFSQAEEFFALYAKKSFSQGVSKILSIGSGNCDTEVRIARLLGSADFVIECLDMNPDMLARGRALAERDGVAPKLAFTQGDFNAWRPSHKYQAVIANQALHHVTALEHLYDAVAVALAPGGRFIVADMIGRNGHRRWPEARAIVDEFWAELPPAYRYNRQLGRREDRFMDWDHSVAGFEGIRAQDVLPLLVARFRFEMFLPFANLIDPFIDRAFGYNFDPQRDWDRHFIDRVHARDEQEILAGRIKPTHMFAVLSLEEPVAKKYRAGLTPEACIRPS
ncbi:MAG: class I SAM-dependent methyltransferase [Betaproteobacteria bacterium]